MESDVANEVAGAAVANGGLPPGAHETGAEASNLKRLYFIFFVVSGACGLVYEIAWLRLAMANFGVTTPMISIVLSVFMAGLGLGSWGGGRLARRLAGGTAAQTLRRYALLELLIGISGVVVVPLLGWGRLLSERIQNAAGLGSLGVYLVAGAWVTVALLPWCTCMGATIPLVMAAMEKSVGEDGRRSFSLLYLANVLGAVLGTLLPAFVLFELIGFRATLYCTATVNALLACGVVWASRMPAFQTAGGEESFAPGPKGTARAVGTDAAAGRRLNLWLLFLTGFTSMALEVIWVRQFTPYLGTVVYSFAVILALYLVATFEGSSAYRKWNREQAPGRAVVLWMVAGLCALIPLFSADPRMKLDVPGLPSVFRPLLGVAPFSGVVGFLTPMLVDDWCGGDPRRGGKAYGVNVAGCILGQLAAGFLVLPWVGERWGTVLLAAPLFLAGALAVANPSRFAGAVRRSGRMKWMAAAMAVAAVALVAGTRNFASKFTRKEVKRDYAATVIATGAGMQKELLVNGVGITVLAPVTKMMADLPLAFLGRPAKNVLVICFGMGTTFRSMLSWGVPTTAVELVPSVPKLFGYYHADGPELLKSPLAHVVIDDGRRFLERTTTRYDVIAIDPPPPVEAAGSSLLYSREFYTSAKRRLRPGGILAQWLPGGDRATQAAVALSLRDSFRYVRVFLSIENRGWHFLASDSPIRAVSAQTLAARMPAAAVRDMLEWGPYASASEQIDAVLSRELSIGRLIARDPQAPALSDDRPVNEYFLLRWLLKLPAAEREAGSGP